MVKRHVACPFVLLAMTTDFPARYGAVTGTAAKVVGVTSIVNVGGAAIDTLSTLSSSACLQLHTNSP